MSHPLLSILIPAHNVEKYISRCLSSIYDTDVPLEKFEVIFVDDFSSDKTLEVAVSGFQNKPNIHFYKNPKNLGAGLTKNEAYGQSSGAYVWVIDSDDYLVPKGLDEVVSLIEASHPDCVYINHKVCKKLGEEPLDNRFTEVTSPQKLACMCIAPWARAYKRELYVRYPSYNPEDCWPFYEFVDKVDTVVSTPNCIYCYNKTNPDGWTRFNEFCAKNSFTLEQAAFGNILERNGLKDEWMAGILHNLADMYSVRKRIKHDYALRAWAIRFKEELKAFFTGHYMQ